MVVALIIISATIWGTRFSFGVFFKSIESEFNLSRAATSGVFSLYMALCSIFAILGGWAIDRYGSRIIILLMGLFTGLSLLLTSQTNSAWQLFVTYSLLLAIGSGATYAVTMSTVLRWFDKKRGFALGVASSGVGLGMLVMPPFATYLISSFDWRMAYIVMGLIAWLVMIPLSRLLRKDSYEIGTLPDGVDSAPRQTGIKKPKNSEDTVQPTDLSLQQVFRTRNFWLFMFVWFLFASCVFLVLTHIVPYATDIGVSAEEAAAALGLIGGASIAGRVLMGMVSDRIGTKATAIICSLFQGGAMVLLIWLEPLWMLYLFALVYGFAFGGLAPVVTALIGDIFGLRNIGMILGVLDCGWGGGAAIGSAMGGLIFDVTNSYFMAWVLGAVAMLIVILFIAPIKRDTYRTFEK